MSLSPPPLGAHWNGAGTTFAVHAEPAEALDVCIFDAHGRERRIPLERTGHTWWAAVEEVGPGTTYGFRATGPGPMDPAKLLVDPYARAIVGDVTSPEVPRPASPSPPGP